MKTILITGAGRRLGKVLADSYLSEGWRVLAHYNTLCELAEHPCLRTFQADLADTLAIESLCVDVTESLLALGDGSGPMLLDGVIHNASCFVPDCAVEGSLLDQMKHLELHWRVHVGAPSMLVSALDGYWAEKASVVAISDIYADIPNERFAAYCASKAGLQNLSLSLAQRLAGRVRVNVIQPGPIKFLPEHSEEYRERVLSQSLIRQELGYDAIVQACDYLMNTTAVTGSVMRVDGGRFVANRYDQTFDVSI